MSETKDTDTPSGRKPMTLKRTQGAGTVRQSFSHGRTKNVVVEKKRRRVVTSKGAGDGASKHELSPEQKAAKALGLSEEEVRRRQAALQVARAAASERQAEKQAEADARQQREVADRQRLEEERASKDAVEAARVAEEALEVADKEATLARQESGVSDAAPVRRADKPSLKHDDGDDNLKKLGGRVKRARPGGPGPGAPKQPARGSGKGVPSRRRQKLTITSALDGEGGERQRSIAALRRAREKERQRRATGSAEREKISREVIVPEDITVAELANRMTERASDVIKYLMKQGQMMRPSDVVDADTAELIVEEFGHTLKRVSESDVEQGFLTADDDDDSTTPRWPVVTVMGHVDHGKTSLLDALRSTDVAAGEAGGITQHIGAYQVVLKSGEKITFLDTPGHAAFSAMRARGANATDIIILVVAADDGVMPQTIEAISHAKASGAPIIVAVNKCDKPDANPQKVLQDLLQHEIVVEAMSGDVQAIEVSATKKTGLDQLVEAITLQAELLELTANPDRPAEGVVIESKLAKGRGPVATMLVKRGTLKRGDIVVAGATWGRVKALTNERGQTMKSAGPSEPIEVLGFSEPPDPGEPFAVVETEARARELTEYRERARRDRSMVTPDAAASLEQMMAKLKDKSISELPLLVKADVQGSAEAITQSVEKIGRASCRERV